jgi:hypothetical protein
MSDPAKTAGVTTFITTEDPPMDLFRINPGVPCDYALEQVSTLLGCVHKLIEAGAVDNDGEMIWSAYYLSGFAKAIIQDVEVGRMISTASFKA